MNDKKPQENNVKVSEIVDASSGIWCKVTLTSWTLGHFQYLKKYTFDVHQMLQYTQAHTAPLFHSIKRDVVG
jgi:hypothetical protein